jgi:hypothetical protein
MSLGCFHHARLPFPIAIMSYPRSFRTGGARPQHILLAQGRHTRACIADSTEILEYPSFSIEYLTTSRTPSDNQAQVAPF